MTPAERRAQLHGAIIDKYRAGVPVKDIADELGVARATVFDVIRKNGVPKRGPSSEVAQLWRVLLQAAERAGHKPWPGEAEFEFLQRLVMRP